MGCSAFSIYIRIETGEFLPINEHTYILRSGGLVTGMLHTKTTHGCINPRRTKQEKCVLGTGTLVGIFHVIILATFVSVYILK